MQSSETLGFVYAAKGAKYIDLALNSARSLKDSTPGATVHLYCDSHPAEGHCFDAVHLLSESQSKRPKFEALRRAEFDRTIYLDADTFVCADISDIFFTLDRFDIAGAHVVLRNSRHSHRTHKIQFPNSFPQINTGVLAIRKSQRMSDFLAQVDAEMAAADSIVDQPIFRELLWLSDLRIAVLPPEYNFKRINEVVTMSSAYCAPRIIHDSDLRRPDGKAANDATTLEGFLRRGAYRHLIALLSADKFLSPGSQKKVSPLARVPRAKRQGKLRKLLGLG
ncbi:hypothetical protein GYB14_05020 [bacterium]|nr:hypothetical protein [bacterium]